MNKVKNVCLLDQDNYFLENRFFYLDPKTKEFKIPENGLEINPPDLNKLKLGHKAQWDKNKKEWVYDEIENNDTFIMKNLNPDYFFKIARTKKLQEVENYILDKFISGEVVIDEKLIEYKEKIYNLPKLIMENKIEKPQLKNDIELYKKTKNPEDILDFNWPSYSFEE